MIYAGDSDILRLIWRHFDVKSKPGFIYFFIKQIGFMHTWTGSGLLFPWQPRDRDAIVRRQPREPHKKERGNVFLRVLLTVRGTKQSHDGARIRWAQGARASTMGLNFNKVKCRYVPRLSLNEITLQAEQVSSCCFCAALIMQPRWPRPRSYAHKVNTSSLATLQHQSIHGTASPITANLQQCNVAVGTRHLSGFRSLVLARGNMF